MRISVQDLPAVCSFRSAKIACALLVVLGTASGCATKNAFGHLSNDQEASTFNAELGTSYLMAGELEPAELKLDRALEQDPNNALANNSYGKLLATLDDPVGAERAFVKSVRNDPKRAEYRNNFGIFLCDQGRTDEAISQFVEASKNKFYRTPEFALDNAGVCAMDASRHALADQYLRSAIRLNPRFAPSMLHMAELKLATDDVALADAYYTRYLNLSRQTPHSLEVGISVKRALGEETAAQEYARQLVSNYPTSNQAKTLHASN